MKNTKLKLFLSSGFAPTFTAGFCSLLTSVLLTLSFPAFDFGWIAWVALVPLMLAIRALSPRQAFLAGLLSGIGAAYGIFGWLFNVPGFNFIHSLLLALYFGCYVALWASGVSFLSFSRIPLILTAPALWVSLDYLKAHVGFLSVPWASLAHSQHNNLPLLQVASITGEYGVTFLVIMANVIVFMIISQHKWREVICAMLILVSIHLWGYALISRDIVARTLKVAVVQPNILYRERISGEGRTAVIERLRTLSLEASTQKPSLIVWPETAVHNISSDTILQKELQAISSQTGVPVLTGSSDYAKLHREPGMDNIPARTYNSAFLISPKKGIQEPYRKHILLPFAEYLPFESTVSWPSWLVPQMFHVIPGNKIQPFYLDKELKFTTIICWENMFPHYVNESVQSGSSFLIHLANDVWFGRSAAARQHNLASVLRAVEHRIPVVVASNTGPSQIISPLGQIRKEVPQLFSTGTIIAEIPVTTAGTFYTKHGDWVALGMIFFVASLFVTRLFLSLTKIISKQQKKGGEPLNQNSEPASTN